MYLDKQYIRRKLRELLYVLNMFHIIQNQLALYILALPDMPYAIAEIISPSYFAPAPNASKIIHYEQLFEVLKTVL
jgi:hypothetical protein